MITDTEIRALAKVIHRTIEILKETADKTYSAELALMLELADLIAQDEPKLSENLEAILRGKTK